jgi:heme exporter protein A
VNVSLPQQQQASVDEAVPAPCVPCVKITRLSKRFERRGVLRSIDMELFDGECVVLLGANGAGKTTLLRILATLSRPSSGSVMIAGHLTHNAAQAVRAQIGVVAHQPYLYADLTASENLHFFARMYGVEDERSRIDEVLFLVGLISRRDDRVRTFSRGMQQRLAIGRAILHRPTLLLLDEPDSGLDREGAHVLERILGYHRSSGGAVLMTTHDLRFGLAVGDRVLLLENGKLVLDAPARTLEEADLDERLSRR